MPDCPEETQFLKITNIKKAHNQKKANMHKNMTHSYKNKPSKELSLYKQINMTIPKAQ